MTFTLLAACGGDAFSPECEEGTVRHGDQCVLVRSGGSGGAGAAGASGTAGWGGGSAGSPDGKGGMGSTAGSASGKGGTGGAGGSGGNAAGAGSNGGQGASAGTGGAGASGSGGGMAGTGMGAAGGAGGGGGGGKGGAGTGGMSGMAGTGAAGASGSGSAGAAGGTAGGGGAGAAGAGATGGTAGAAGVAGAGGGAGCSVESCPVQECHEATCEAGACALKPAPAGQSCATGVCNGMGDCGDCAPGQLDCDGKTPRSCSQQGSWVAGIPCAIGCSKGACTTVASLAAGGPFLCALLSDKTVRCWGSDNSDGELGSPTPSSSGTTQVSGLKGVTSLAVGVNFGCARVDDGTVWCWGDNTWGQLAQDVSIPRSATPMKVPGLDDAMDVFAGPRAGGACATTKTGALVCWGDQKVLAQVALDDVKAVTRGDNLTCARTGGGAVFCWGRNSEGQCGDGSVGGPDVLGPKQALISGVEHVAAGRSHVCAVGPGGAVSCWGLDLFGQLGDGLPTASQGTPVPTGLAGVDRLAVGGYFGCARTAAGVSCWGRDTPSTQDPAPVLFSNVGAPSEIAATGGSSRACGIFGPADVRCWEADAPPVPVTW